MNRSNKILKVFFICIVLFILYNYPFMTISQRILGVPRIVAYYTYIFCLWGLIILFFGVYVVKLIKKESDE